jgi:DNA-binding response OmpR family regulator
MKILIVEDEFLLGLLVGETLADAGHEILGPAACPAEALRLVADNMPGMAFVDIELAGRSSGIELATELGRRGIRCVFATGQPERAREHRELALGLVPKPYNPMTLIEVARYVTAIAAGERGTRVPRGFEPFALQAESDTAGVDSRQGAAPYAVSRVGISQSAEPLPEGGVLAAVAG